MTPAPDSVPTAPRGAMNGSIDSVIDNRVFTGWVLNHARIFQGREILVLITCNGQEIGRGKPSYPRFDIVKDPDYWTGFRVTCDRIVNDDDILFGRIGAQFSDCDGATAFGEIWDNVRARAAHTSLQSALPLGPLAGKLMLDYLAKSGFAPHEAIASTPPADDVPEMMESQTSSAKNIDQWLLGQFESLGRDCTFGMIQTHANATHLGLMKFSEVSLEGLMDALADRFAGVGVPEFTKLSVDTKGEYRTSDRRFGMSAHTKVHVGEVDEANFAQRQFSRIRYLVRNFLEDVEAGETILVIHAMHGRIDGDRLAELLEKIRKIGPAPVLYIEAATERNSAGHVERLGDGLLVGFVAATPTQQFQTTAESLASWIGVCRKAYQLAFNIDDLDAHFQRIVAARNHDG